MVAAAFAASALMVAPGLTPRAFALHGPPFPFCVDGKASLFLTGSGTPGETDTFAITSEPAGKIAFSLQVDGTYTAALEVPMTFGSDGTAQTPDFYMVGLATGISEVVATSPLQGEADRLEVIVDRITEVELTDSNDEPLEADPKNPTAGDDFRIFPDVPTPGMDVTPFRRVKATAHTELGTENLRVEFRAWDVDDPSSDSTVDPNGGVGGDNLGGASFGPSASLTDGNGDARTTLTVSQRPGDNFRVTASCVAGLQNTIGAFGIDVTKPDGQPAAEVRQSGLITVWRHLHIEADSMGRVDGNELRGTVSRAQNSTLRRRGNPPFAGIKVVLPRDMIDSAGNEVSLGIFDRDEFADGEIVISGNAYPVRFSEGSTFWIDSGPDPRAFKGASITLVDDDKLGGSLHDDGTEVPQPDLSKLSESDDPATNWFADVYIRPVHLPGGDSNLPFRINLDEPRDGYCRVLVTPCPADQISFDNAAHAADPNYWVVYLLGAYQGPLATDGDPDGDPFTANDATRVTLERADDANWGAAIFFESIRDEAGGAFGELCSAGGVAVHGLGHLFIGSGHVAGDAGIMAANCVDGSGNWSGVAQRAIRASVAP